MGNVLLTGFLGFVFTLIGSIQCFQTVPDAYVMRLETIRNRYQPALVSIAPGTIITNRLQNMLT